VDGITVFLLSGLCAGIGATIVYVIFHRLMSRLKEELSATKTELAVSQQQVLSQESQLNNVKQQLSESFAGLSEKALRHNSDMFLKLAHENFKQQQLMADKQLSDKEKSIEVLVKPIKEALDKTEKQIHEIEKERKQAYGALSEHLKFMAEAQTALQNETRSLVNALSRPSVRGQWGELTLRRLVELAGMVKHCDFNEQTHTATDPGAIRPDMLIRMPGQREIVVDAKTPLDAYLKASECNDDNERKMYLAKHARHLRERVKELSAKQYWSQFKRSPDFVLLFIPGDQFLNSALDNDPDLLEFALQHKVMLATPISLVALLRAIAYGWRQETLADNAEQIREIGTELYGRLYNFSEHLNRLGKSLNGSVQHFNKAVGSFDARILSGARKFKEMGIESKKDIDNPEQIDHQARTLSLPDVADDTIKHENKSSQREQQQASLLDQE